MRLPRPHSSRLRRDPRRRPIAAAPAPVEPGEAAPTGDPEDEPTRAEVADAGFRASYELQRGLDVVELPTSLPADVLERLFKSPQR